MLVLKAFFGAILTVALFVGILLTILTWHSGGAHSPELYPVVGKVFGAGVGVLFPIFLMLFWIRRRKVLAMKSENP